MIISESWVLLLIAIFFGVLGTISMKLSQGLKKWKPCVCLFIFYLACFIALTLAMQGIDLSIIYAFWSGVGTIFVAFIGVVIFKESWSIKKMVSLLFIVMGVIGLHLTNAFH